MRNGSGRTFLAALALTSFACGTSPAAPTGLDISGLWSTPVLYSTPTVTGLEATLTLRLRQSGNVVTGILGSDGSAFQVTGTLDGETLSLGGAVPYPANLATRGNRSVIESFTARVGPRDRLRGTLVLRRAWANSGRDILYSADFDILGRRDLETFATEPSGRWSGTFASVCRSPQPPFFCPLQYNSAAGTGLEMRLARTGTTISGEFRFEDEYSPTVVPVAGELHGREIVFSSPSQFNFRECRFVLNEWAGMTGTCVISFYPFSEEYLEVFQMLKLPE